MKTSVALCTCNGARYIDAQLHSIAAGSIRPDEIVVCDDRSDDNTLDLTAEFARTSGITVHIHRNEHRLGSTRNFEKAIGLARFDIVFLCDQDDVWRVDRIERSLREFADPSVGAVFSDAELVDEQLQPLGKRMFDYLGIRDLILKDRADLFGRLLTKSFVTGATMAFRRDLAMRITPYPASRFFIHDGWLALAIAGMSRLVVIDEPLISYRQHGGQQVGTLLSGIAQNPAAKPPIAYPFTRLGYRELYAELEQGLSGVSLRPAAKARLADAVAHNEQRLAMRGRILARPFSIGRELLKGRYHRYSSGLASAASDLIRPQ